MPDPKDKQNDVDDVVNEPSPEQIPREKPAPEQPAQRPGEDTEEA